MQSEWVQNLVKICLDNYAKWLMGCALCRGWLEMKLCRSWDLSCSTGNLKGEWMAHGGMACMDTPCNSAQTSAQTSPAPGKEALQPHSNDTLSAVLQTQHCEMWTREVAQELPWALAAARSNSTLGCTNRSIGTASREMMTLLNSLDNIWSPFGGTSVQARHWQVREFSRGHPRRLGARVFVLWEEAERMDCGVLSLWKGHLQGNRVAAHH